MSATRPGIPTGVHLIFRKAGQVLLMRRANTGFFDGLFSLPGGHLEPGESIRAAAVREAREELDLRLDPAALGTVGVMHRRSDSNRIDFFLRVVRWQGEARLAEPHKCDRLEWFPEASLPSETVAYVRTALAMERPAPWILELGWESPGDEPSGA